MSSLKREHPTWLFNGNTITLNGVADLEEHLNSDELSAMNKRVNDILSCSKFSCVENRILAEKMLKIGYLSSFCKYTE